jgi:hypothetical protein
MASVARYCCCGAENPCVSGDPPLEVTVSWVTNPTGNAHWEATETGKIDLFGETWANGDTKLICPDSYTFAVVTSYAVAQWQHGGGGAVSRIAFSDRALTTGATRVANSLYEDVQTTGNSLGANDAAARAAYTTSSGSPVGSQSVSLQLNAKTSISVTELQAAAGLPVNFGAFGGSMTTNETITIAWQKSSFFPTGNV